MAKNHLVYLFFLKFLSDFYHLCLYLPKEKVYKLRLQQLDYFTQTPAAKLAKIARRLRNLRSCKWWFGLNLKKGEKLFKEYQAQTAFTPAFNIIATVILMMMKMNKNTRYHDWCNNFVSWLFSCGFTPALVKNLYVLISLISLWGG